MAATDGRSPAVVDVEEQQRRRVEMGIAKLKGIADGASATEFSTKDYLETYTAAFNLCTAAEKRSENSAELYALYRRTLEDHLASTVVPSLRQKQGELLLRELALRWSKHRDMVHWLSACFAYLDRIHVPRNNLPTLGEVGLDCFRTPVLQEFSGSLKDALRDFMGREREGGATDTTLTKNIFDFFVEMDSGSLE